MDSTLNQTDKDKEIALLNQKVADLQAQVNYLTTYRRLAVTCQECYDEGIYVGELHLQKYKNLIEYIKVKLNGEVTDEVISEVLQKIEEI